MIDEYARCVVHAEALVRAQLPPTSATFRLVKGFVDFFMKYPTPPRPSGNFWQRLKYLITGKYDGPYDSGAA